MTKRNFIIAGVFATVASTLAYADFSSAEFGTGTFSTGTGSATVLSVEPAAVSQSLCGGDGCDSTETAAMTALGDSVIADGSVTSDGTAAQDAVVNFFDSDQDGTMTAAEVTAKFAAISGVSFSESSDEQAGALLKGIANNCTSGIDAACLALAAQEGVDFIDDAVSATSNLGALKNAMIAGTNYTVTDSDPLKIFDTDKDGEISDSEFVALLATDPDGGSDVNTGNNGLYARAYVSEIENGLSVASAIETGNTYAVHAPKLGSIPTIALSGASSTHASGLINVFDGTCASSDGSGCTAAPSNVTHTITQTHTPPGSSSATAASGTKFQLNDAGKIVLASGVGIQDLDAGTYTLSIVSTDAGSKTYAKQSTAQSATLTVSNENGCITNTQVAGSDFTAGSGDITGAAVTISDHHNNSDLLFIKGASSTTTLNGRTYSNFGYSGVTAEYTSSSGMLRFYGDATAAQWADIFQKVGYIYNSGGSASENERDLVFSLSNTVPYQHTDGGWRFYKFFSHETIDFDTLMDDFDDGSHTSSSDDYYLFGLRPYLATITSQAEQNYINPKILGQGWIGGCDNLSGSGTRLACNVGDNEFDDDTNRTDGQPFQNSYKGEGKWVWVAGPERGLPIGSDGDTDQCDGGSFTNATGAYSNWAGGEPNNCNHEHFLHVYGGGSWNDYSRTDNRINGYIVEWGGPTADTTFGRPTGSSSALTLTTTKTYDMSTDGGFCVYQ